jgi:predicted DNA-binding transcriptional regulator AlpA
VKFTPVKVNIGEDRLMSVNDLPVLLGTSELTRRWGITRERIWQLVRADRIPPGQQVSGIRIWTLAEIEAYEATPDGTARLARARRTPPRQP